MRRNTVRITLLFALVSAALLRGAPAAAQAVRGTVVDDQNLSRVSTATVRLVDGSEAGQGTETDAQGRFFLLLPHAGEYRLEVSRLGYMTTRSQVFRVEGEDTLSVEFRVAPNAVLMAPMTVTARSNSGRALFRKHQDDWGKGVFLTPDQIASMHLTSPADVFRGMEDVNLTWSFGSMVNGRRGWIPQVHSQQGVGCLLYMVNHVWVNPPETGGHSIGRRVVHISPEEDYKAENLAVWTNYQVAEMPPSEIAAVEVFRSYSEVPPGLRRFTHKFPLSNCGLVVYWTKGAW